MTGLAKFLKVVGYSVFIAAGVWAFVLVVAPVYHWLLRYIGYFAAPVVLVISPIIVVIGPFYQAFAHGWWLPLAVCYGGMALSAVLWGLAGWIDSRAPSH